MVAFDCQSPTIQERLPWIFLEAPKSSLPFVDDELLSVGELTNVSVSVGNLTNIFVVNRLHTCHENLILGWPKVQAQCHP